MRSALWLAAIAAVFLALPVRADDRSLRLRSLSLGPLVRSSAFAVNIVADARVIKSALVSDDPMRYADVTVRYERQPALQTRPHPIRSHL